MVLGLSITTAQANTIPSCESLKSFFQYLNAQLVPNGGRIPLKEIASYEIARGDVAINHLEGRREIQVSADIKDPKKTSSTDIMDEIENEIMPEILAKYPTVTPSFEGQNREFSKLNDSLKPVGLIVLLLIYIVIAFTTPQAY